MSFATIALLFTIAGDGFTPTQRAWIDSLTQERVERLMQIEKALNEEPRGRHRDRVVVTSMTLTSAIVRGRPYDFLDKPEIVSGQSVSVWFEAKTPETEWNAPNVSVSIMWYHEHSDVPDAHCTTIHVLADEPTRASATCRPDIPGNWRVVLVHGMRALDYRTFSVILR